MAPVTAQVTAGRFRRPSGVARSMSTLPDNVKSLLDAGTYVTLTTLKQDGTPHSTVMWADYDGEDIVFATVIGRLKEKHLRNDPRVAVSLFDPENPYSYTTINGTATLNIEGGKELIQQLSQKYRGQPYTWDEGTDNVRVVVRVTPEPGGCRTGSHTGAEPTQNRGGSGRVVRAVRHHRHGCGRVLCISRYRNHVVWSAVTAPPE